MRKKALFLALLSLTIAFSACNKDDDDESERGIPKIKNESRYSDGKLISSITYEYDNAGRLSKYTSETKEYSIYKYETGKIIISYYDANANLKNGGSILLNENGLRAGDGNTSYEYDTEGYLLKTTIKENYPWTYTISNGNTVKWTEKSEDNYSPYLLTRSFKFLTNINTIGNENKGFTWLGKQDKNLQSQLHQYSTDGSRTYEYTATFTYEYDAHGRVTKQNTTIDDGDSSYKTFTYY